MLKLVFWLQTHIFFGTLESGVVQNDGIIWCYWSWLRLGFLHGMAGRGWRLGRGWAGVSSSLLQHTGATHIEAHASAKSGLELGIFDIPVRIRCAVCQLSLFVAMMMMMMQAPAGLSVTLGPPPQIFECHRNVKPGSHAYSISVCPQFVRGFSS
jgi:hypothetical protein